MFSNGIFLLLRNRWDDGDLKRKTELASVAAVQCSFSKTLALYRQGRILMYYLLCPAFPEEIAWFLCETITAMVTMSWQ